MSDEFDAVSPAVHELLQNGLSSTFWMLVEQIDQLHHRA
jgi:hypothetical protein